MSDTTAKIRGKGLEHTGVTEDHATEMWNHVGGYYVGVVTLKVKTKHGPDDEGNRSVDLVVDSIELAPNDDVAEHLRRLLRAAHYERGLAVNGGDQMPLEGTQDEPTVEQVRAAGRDLEVDPEADERAAAEHELDDHDDAEPDAVEAANPDDDTYDPHPFTGSTGYACQICDQPAGAAVHTDTDTDDTTSSATVSPISSPFTQPTTGPETAA